MIKTIFVHAPFAVGLLIMFGLVFPNCRQLQLRTRTQAIWAMVILFCCSKFLCFKAFGGDEFNPDLPAAVIWIWDWLYSGAIILAALALLTVFFRFRAKLWVLPAIAWCFAAWGLYNGFSVPAVHEVELTYSDLPASLDGYRIVQLSDLHCSSAATHWRTEAVVEKVNALTPDLICLTGDLADGKASRIARHLEPIKELRAKDGVYACTGNHEYYFDYYGWMAQFYAKAKNVRFLTNECVFPHPGLALGGVPDKVGRGRGLDAAPDPRGAFAAATNGEFRVLLQHQPKTAAVNCREVGVGLQLSGHTHGGIAPLFRRLVERHNGGFSRGLYPLSGAYLYVSPGCGQWAGFPMRFFNDSEITLLTLRRRQTKGEGKR